MAADEFYGNERGLRRDLQARATGYVLCVARSHRVTLGDATTATVEKITTNLPKRAFNRVSAGKGAKGERPKATRHANRTRRGRRRSVPSPAGGT